MFKIEKITVKGWETAIRGMRNAWESWERSDTDDYPEYKSFRYGTERFESVLAPEIGKNDLQLMRNLAAKGDVHGKFMRFLIVTADITAPLYWWKQYDTYKVGTATLSGSTMHNIAKKEFSMGDFSTEHLDYPAREALERVINLLNVNRIAYLQSKQKDDWWQMIQVLPESYNQKRTVLLNYSVLRNMYKYRKDHRLDEWNQFRAVMEKLPYAELITGAEKDKADADEPAKGTEKTE